MKHLLFLDLKDLETIVDLPDDIKDSTIQSATLINYSFEGQPDVPPGQAGRADHFYVQLKFDGCLESRTLTHGSRPDMVPLPLRSFNDWGGIPSLNIPIGVRHMPFKKSFRVGLFGEGIAPQPFQLANGYPLRVLLWIVLEVS